MTHTRCFVHAAGLAVAASAAGLAPLASADVVAVPIGDRVEVFEVPDARGKRASADRLDAAPARVVDGRLRAVPDRGVRRFAGVWDLTDLVAVHAGDRGAAARAAGLPEASFAPVEGRPGWFTIETGSVRTAAAIAGVLARTPGVRSAEVVAAPPFDLRGAPDDPLLAQQWHLDNALDPDIDVRATEAWAMGYTGLGVTIGIVESGGFLTSHEDLAPGFNPAVSQPNQFTSSHMTQVAGIAAGAGDNGLGIAGAAYNAALAQRLIGNNFTTSRALTDFNDIIDVKNNSWGPSDDGRFDFPSPLIMSALATAAETGRGGLGEIIVWAGGNGASADDRVDYDPYASSRYAVGVGAVGDNDRRASYSEPGASLLISAYSNGGSRGITTTTSSGGYSANFGGTSAAAPLAAGVVALMLEANPALTWRDVQHILVASARPVDPGSEGWSVNGAGLLHNDDYGFGMLDALDAVTLAENWAGAGPEVSGSSGIVGVAQAIPDGSPVGLSVPIPVDAGVVCESVELVLDIQTESIGDLRISLVSPDGTTSVLARPRNDPQDNYPGTLFTSVRHWGERADGQWLVRVSDEDPGNPAVWNSAEIRVYGTEAGEGPCSAADLAEPFGVLDLADTLAFVIAFQTGDQRADFAPPFGALDEADLGGFVQAFLAGCGE
jgi:subtilisin-like proprotein convertase family protein